MITVAVPPQRLGWLCSQLDANRIPYQEDGRGNVTTLEAAQPIVDQVLGYEAHSRPQQRRRGGLDALTATLCHILLVVLGLILLWLGMWEAFLFAMAGELFWRFLDVRQEQAFRRAEAVGYDMSRDRRGDVLFNLGIAAVLAYCIWFFGSKAMGVL